MKKTDFISPLEAGFECWDYKAEGFDSVILSYVGPNPSQYSKKCLRLFKVQNPGFQRAGSEPPADFTAFAKLHDDVIQKYVSPYLPTIDKGEMVSISGDFVRAMAEKIEPKRPSKRIAESHVSLESRVALLHDDHITPDSLVVEIKPKWGFLPDCPKIPIDSVKRSVSRYQLMQRYKLQKGVIHEMSEYDPLDLFSNDFQRIKKAVISLIKCPQGNLKVFRNGSTSKLEESEIDTIVKFLKESSVFSDILRIQRLDLFDVEFMEPICQKANSPTWFDLVDPIIIQKTTELLEKDARLPSDAKQVDDLIASMDETTARSYVTGFLLSLAAKDCSIMFNIKGEKCEVSVIDFDLKLPQCIVSNYASEDRKIVAAYKAMTQ